MNDRMTQELTELWNNPSCRSVAELALMLMFRRSVSDCQPKGTLMSGKVVYTLRCPCVEAPFIFKSEFCNNAGLYYVVLVFCPT
jgi:hypothetical protein